jgi:hypothetical protein
VKERLADAVQDQNFSCGKSRFDSLESFKSEITLFQTAPHALFDAHLALHVAAGGGFHKEPGRMIP